MATDDAVAAAAAAAAVVVVVSMGLFDVMAAWMIAV